MNAPSPLADALRGYSRYLATVAEQLDLAGSGDWERLAALDLERKRIEDEVGPSQEDESGGLPSLDELLETALAEVTEKLEADRLDKDQWVQISSGALSSARSLSLRPAAAAGRYPEPGAPGERLDLRF